MFVANFVRQTGMYVQMIEAIRQNRNHQNYHTEEGGKPEIAVDHGHRQRSNIRTADDVIVEVVGNEVEHNTAPDRDVIEDRPIAGVDGNLQIERERERER